MDANEKQNWSLSNLFAWQAAITPILLAPGFYYWQGVLSVGRTPSAALTIAAVVAPATAYVSLMLWLWPRRRSKQKGVPFTEQHVEAQKDTSRGAVWRGVGRGAWWGVVYALLAFGPLWLIDAYRHFSELVGVGIFGTPGFWVVTIWEWLPVQAMLISFVGVQFAILGAALGGVWALLFTRVRQSPLTE